MENLCLITKKQIKDFFSPLNIVSHYLKGKHSFCLLLVTKKRKVLFLWLKFIKSSEVSIIDSKQPGCSIRCKNTGLFQHFIRPSKRFKCAHRCHLKNIKSGKPEAKFFIQETKVSVFQYCTILQLRFWTIKSKTTMDMFYYEKIFLTRNAFVWIFSILISTVFMNCIFRNGLHLYSRCVR